eukprot:TRINITY_DN2649_c0_g1_i5.p1 TRINITY_DN2649_c0_g1~~TRINITY_DN2649_c0_g1_i5.p1  ORF type:complete len:436 (+),score=41.45 TRINITY_DN2649_c0_g1_i5:130-1437(+)
MLAGYTETSLVSFALFVYAVTIFLRANLARLKPKTPLEVKTLDLRSILKWSSVSPKGEYSSLESLTMRYLMVFCLIRASDWLEGPYIRAIYEQNGFNQDEIAFFYIVYNASTLVFSYIIGRIADLVGRKKICAANGFLFGLTYLLRISSDWNLVTLSCIIRGMYNVTLYTSYDGWIVAEFKAAQLSTDYFKSFYELLTNVDSFMTIGMVLSSSFFSRMYGNEFPFYMSALCATVSSFLILLLWKENIKIEEFKNGQNERFKWTKNLFLLFVADCSFLVSLYSFVFLWPKLLEEVQPGINTGLVFCTFMSALYFGSTIFKIADQALSVSPEKIKVFGYLYGVAGFCLVSMHGTLTTLIIGLLLYEVGYGIILPSMSVVRSKLFPRSHHSSLLGLKKIPPTTINIFMLYLLNDTWKTRVTFLFLGTAVVSHLSLIHI